MSDGQERKMKFYATKHRNHPDMPEVRPDFDKVRNLAYNLGTLKKETPLYLRISNLRLKFNYKGEIIQVAEQTANGRGWRILSSEEDEDDQRRVD